MRLIVPTWAGVVSLLVVSLVGCTESSVVGDANTNAAPATVISPIQAARASADPAWADYIDQLFATGSLSNFERQVLADYTVTDSEYATAKDDFAQCMADHGWVVTFRSTPSSGYEVTPMTGNIATDSSTDNSRCQSLWLGSIQAVYEGMLYNPSDLSRDQLIRQCYQTHDVPDGASDSDDQFHSMIWDDKYIPSSPAAALCFFNPDGSLPYLATEDEAWDFARQKANNAGVPFDGVTPTP